MNKENATQWLPLITALAEGKTVEKRDGDGRFKDFGEYKWDGDVHDYRVKPEDLPIKSPGQVAYETYCLAHLAPSRWDGYEDKQVWGAVANAVLAHAEAQKTVPVAETTYLALTPGVSKLEEGDELSCAGLEWYSCDPSVVGQKLNLDLKGRRKVSTQEPTPDPAWTPPEPPEGRQWHNPTKECWEDGKRALLEGETTVGGVDEFRALSGSVWMMVFPPEECAITLARTSRPLPEATYNIVPLEFSDINPGDRFRMKGYDRQWWVVAYAGEVDISLLNTCHSRQISSHCPTYRTLAERWERCPFGSNEWIPCSKKVIAAV